MDFYLGVAEIRGTFSGVLMMGILDFVIYIGSLYLGKLPFGLIELYKVRKR